MSGPGLRELLIRSAVSLVGLALLAAVALVIVTSQMRANTTLMWHAIESVYVAEELELSLLRHSRERRLYGLSGDERHAAAMAEEDRDLARLMTEAERLVSTPDEAVLLAELEERTTEYLERTAVLMEQGLASVAGSPQILDDALPTALRLVEIVQIERMVEDLLDTARIEAGQLELRLDVHDIGALLEQAMTLHEGASATHRLVLQAPASGPAALARCDGTRIAQVLNNLLGNAIKYSPLGGDVRLVLTATRDAVEVAVTDSGVGIPADELGTIFEPFRRSSNTRGILPGVGLGLAVARRILEAHEGSIAVESRLGHGTTFRFRLPRTDGPPP